MPFSRITTGAKVALAIGGRIVGTVTSFSYNIATPSNEIGALDSLIPYEEAVTVVRVSGQITVIRRLSDGGASGLGITTPIPNLSTSKYFTLQLIEIPTGTVIFSANSCRLESESWGFAAKGVVMGNLSFKSLDYSSEVQPINS